MRHLLLNATLASLLPLLTACPNPADNAPKAKTEAAKPAKDAPAKDAAKAPAQPAKAQLTDAQRKLAFDNTLGAIKFTGSKVTGSEPGAFTSFKGSMTLNASGEALEAVEVEIDMASVKTSKDQLTGHLKSPDFFDVAKFPKSSFKAQKFEKSSEPKATHTVTGDLTLHGVTKTISFPAAITIAHHQASVTAKFSINRKDFGIVFPGMPDDLIRDDVLLELALATKQANTKAAGAGAQPAKPAAAPGSQPAAPESQPK